MTIDILNDKEVIISREFALIQFNKRVLTQATDNQIPILERLKYLCIVSKNCDELFEVLVAKLLKWDKSRPDKILASGLDVKETLRIVRSAFKDLYQDIYTTYHKKILPELSVHGIDILPPNRWSKTQHEWIHDYFVNNLKPVLTPIGIDSNKPFPRVPNKGLNFIVDLSGIDQFGRDTNFAIVEAPRILPRVIKLPKDISTEKYQFILLQDIIKHHVNELFYSMKIKGCYPFRVTRSAELVVTSSYKNLRSAVSEELNKRNNAECSRLELDISERTPPETFINMLLKQFNLTKQELYLANGPVNLSRLEEIINFVDNPDLLFAPFIPKLPQELIDEPDIFKAIKKRDILIHTPYQSFDPIIMLTKLAADDPNVLAIKMTLYRTGHGSELVNNLINAAKAGKQVVASVELFARFDEETNIEFARQLELAGAHVAYGIRGYKVHSKMLLIIRKECDDLVYYVHLGTGNYHQTTAKIYTDLGLLTCNPNIAKDVNNIFAQITGIGKMDHLKVIYQSPFNLHNLIIENIERETRNALLGKKAEIIAKMNSLMDNQVIRALYRASQAGVIIKLIVRGACALRPNLKGISDNIEIRSIIGRFLEHHRVFYFYNGGKKDLYIASADWMKRNFFKRIETCIPILDKKIKKRIIKECLILALKDNQESWIMNSDGLYSKIKRPKSKAICMQKILINQVQQIR